MLLGTKLRVFPIILRRMRLASVHMGSTKRMLRFEEVWEEIDYGRSYNHLNGKFLLKRGISLLTAYSNFIKSWLTARGQRTLTEGQPNKIAVAGSTYNMHQGLVCWDCRPL